MNNNLLLSNYLLILKSTVEVYIHGTLESSNDDVREVLKHGLDETLVHQVNTYNLMVDYGIYDVNNTKTDDIKKTLKKCKDNN